MPAFGGQMRSQSGSTKQGGEMETGNGKMGMLIPRMDGFIPLLSELVLLSYHFRTVVRQTRGTSRHMISLLSNPCESKPLPDALTCNMAMEHVQCKCPRNGLFVSHQLCGPSLHLFVCPLRMAPDSFGFIELLQVLFLLVRQRLPLSRKRLVQPLDRTESYNGTANPLVEPSQRDLGHRPTLLLGELLHPRDGLDIDLPQTCLGVILASLCCAILGIWAAEVSSIKRRPLECILADGRLSGG